MKLRKKTKKARAQEREPSKSASCILRGLAGGARPSIRSSGASDIRREDLHRSVHSDLHRPALEPCFYIDLHVLTYLDLERENIDKEREREKERGREGKREVEREERKD